MGEVLHLQSHAAWGIFGRVDAGNAGGTPVYSKFLGSFYDKVAAETWVKENGGDYDIRAVGVPIALPPFPKG